MPRSSWSTPPTARSCCKARRISRAPYNRFQEIFANVRARYDAENRAARTVADSLRTRSRPFSPTPPEPPAFIVFTRESAPSLFAMVAYKASTVAGFLRSPEPGCRAMLLYGPDAGLVAERAAALAQNFVKRGERPDRNRSPRRPRSRRRSRAARGRAQDRADVRQARA